MSILIKDMDAPEKCSACRFMYKGVIPSVTPLCLAGGFLTEEKESRDARCPIVEMPMPHGRLIDADALIEDLERQCKEVFRIDAVSPDDYWITRNEAYNEALWKTWVESFGDYLKTRPTIIEADGDNNG